MCPYPTTLKETLWIRTMLILLLNYFFSRIFQMHHLRHITVVVILITADKLTRLHDRDIIHLLTFQLLGSFFCGNPSAVCFFFFNEYNVLKEKNNFDLCQTIQRLVVIVTRQQLFSGTVILMKVHIIYFFVWQTLMYRCCQKLKYMQFVLIYFLLELDQHKMKTKDYCIKKAFEGVAEQGGYRNLKAT